MKGKNDQFKAEVRLDFLLLFGYLKKKTLFISKINLWIMLSFLVSKPIYIPD